MRSLFSTVALLLAAGWAQAQQSLPVTAAPGGSPDWNARIMAEAQSKASAGNGAPQDYRIGPEDLVEISVFEVPELSRTVRVSASGEISLPLIGTMKAAGMSPMQLEQAVTASLRQTYLKDPQVSVFLREYRSDPVSVVGAVKAPGLYQIQTQKTLIELLAMAQGLSESPRMLPGRTIVITHPRSRHAAGSNASGDVTPAQWNAIEEIPLKELLESGDSRWNVPIYPGDVIKVVPAGTFYVAGDVNQPGGFPLTDFDDVSAIQALAMAGGTRPTAKLKEAVVIRRDAQGNRVEEKVDLKELYAGKAEDVRLGSNDILFVPGSVTKAAGLRAIEASIQVATGLLIWGL
jgi:polysaccharide export outer membrane protein